MQDRSRLTAYAEDLAYIHDAGFCHVAVAAANWLVKRLRSKGISSGRIVELGCGSGAMSQVMSQAGYDVLGFDVSADMLAIARRRVPTADFRHESFVAATLPPCVAVTAIGEVFNYLFDARNTQSRLTRLFRNIHAALGSGGVLLFDVAEPGRIGGNGRRRSFVEGSDWACLVDAEEDRPRRQLTRRITSFRKRGEHYRRSYEEHRLRLFDAQELAAQLRDVGFAARTMRSYGDWRFPRGWTGISARKS